MNLLQISARMINAGIDSALPLFCDSEGNTPVHHLVDKNESFTVFETKIRALESDPHFFEMLTTFNNQGQMPMLLITDSHQDLEKKLVKLADYIRQKKVKPLTEEINIDELKFSYKDENEQVKKNLEMAANVVNLTRACFEKSNAHPETNSYTIEEQEDLKLRQDHIQKRISQAYGTNKGFFDTVVKIAKETKLGNSENYSFVAFDIVKENHPKLSVKRFRIANGENVFLVIDQEKIQHSFPWWSDNAVVCDSWLGDVYPVREIPTKLQSRDYLYDSNQTRKTNCLGKLNPKFHRLESKETPGFPS